MMVTVVPILFGALGTVPKGLVKGLKGIEIRGKVYIITKISQNTEKCPGILERLAVIQTPLTLKGIK